MSLLRDQSSSTLERHQVPLDIRDVTDEGEFAGYASVFDIEDSYGTVMAQGCFDRTLSEHSDRGSSPKLLFQHDPSLIIGEHTTLREDDHGLYIEGRLYHKESSIPEAARAHTLMKKRQLDGISIGFSMYDSDSYEYSSEMDAFIIREVNLWENSIVTFPSNPDSRINDVRAAIARGEAPTPRALEQALRRTMGLSERDARRLMSGGYREMINAKQSADDQESALIRLAEAAKAFGSK